MATTTHVNPDDRSNVIYLQPEAQAAWTVWRDVRNQQVCQIMGEEYTSRLAPGALDEIDVGSTLGQLVALATEAANRPVPRVNYGRRLVDFPVERAAEWDVTVMLRDAQDRIDPREPVSLATDQTDTCRHGRPFAGTCADCDAGC